VNVGQQIIHIQNVLTAEQDVTSPSISIPASARAVLAATEPAAIQPSNPSFSMTVKKTSMVDLGSNSNRTDETSAWCIETAKDLSSASYMSQAFKNPL
jgi:hypothetical protein